MLHKIYPAARRRIVEIWAYTDKTWGEKQADRYVRGLYRAIEKAAASKHLWRQVEHKEVEGIFFVRYEHHDIFFRELSKGVLGVVSVLHDHMDIPHRLKEDIADY
jgi:plasmid stabilization system protein ParE